MQKKLYQKTRPLKATASKGYRRQKNTKRKNSTCQAKKRTKKRIIILFRYLTQRQVCGGQGVCMLLRDGPEKTVLKKHAQKSIVMRVEFYRA